MVNVNGQTHVLRSLKDLETKTHKQHNKGGHFQ